MNVKGVRWRGIATPSLIETALKRNTALALKLRDPETSLK